MKPEMESALRQETKRLLNKGRETKKMKWLKGDWQKVMEERHNLC